MENDIRWQSESIQRNEEHEKCWPHVSYMAWWLPACCPRITALGCLVGCTEAVRAAHVGETMTSYQQLYEQIHWEQARQALSGRQMTAALVSSEWAPELGMFPDAWPMETVG